MRATSLDAEPFRQILLDRLEIIERNTAGKSEAMSGRTILSYESGISMRPLYSLLMGQRTITFDVADRIVTRILGPMAWWEREELNEIYMSFDLRRLDYGRPVNETVRQRNIAEVKRAVEKHGSYKDAAEAMGIPDSVLFQVTGNNRRKEGAVFTKPICPNGHDKRVTGATKSGHCKVCRTIRAKARVEEERAYMRENKR